MSQEPKEFPFVDDANTLKDLIKAIAGASLIALDTEFIRERTYFPELCVLQIATDEVIAAVDCLAPIDRDPLFEVLLARDKNCLLHSARQDLEVLFNLAGKLPARLIDTQIAASLIGMPLQIGLQGLLAETLEVEIGKQHTRANWKRRPLPDEFLSYALDDVRYLIPALDRLQARLRTLGRGSWFDEECRRQLELPIDPDTQTIFERTKGAGRLRNEQRAAALALIGWREIRARTQNKPRRWILADDELVRLAAALPESMADLERVRDLPARLVSRSGSQILAAIRDRDQAAEVPESPVADKIVAKSVQSAVKARADELGIQPELLATRRDISMLATGRVPESLSTGWRASVLDDIVGQVNRGQAS
jgi:ribonuclease D